MNYKFYHVCCLPENLQNKVRIAITSALIAEGLEGEELEQAIENGMNSRIYDLEDTIDINKLF
jgi:hypothetical protein